MLRKEVRVHALFFLKISSLSVSFCSYESSLFCLSLFHWFWVDANRVC